MVQYRSISTPVLPRHAHSEEHGRRNVERRPSSRKGSPTQNLRAGQNGTKEPSRFGITVGMIKLLMTTRGGTEKTSLKRVKGEGSAEECTIQRMSASSGPKWAFKISSPQTYFGCYFKVRNLESLSASRAILSRLEHSLRTSWCKKNLACLNFPAPAILPPIRAVDAQPISPDGTCVTDLSKDFLLDPVCMNADHRRKLHMAQASDWDLQ